MNYIKIEFDDIWKTSFFKIDERDRDVFENGFIFEYNEKTTFLDLMKTLNLKIYNTLKKCIEKQTNDLENEQNLKYIYRIIEYNRAVYIFFPDTKIIRYIDEYKKDNIIISSPIFVEKGGRLFTIKNVDFIIHSREKGKHKEPHVHVKYKNYEAVFDFKGNILAGSIPTKMVQVIRDIIKDKEYDLSFAWNTKTDAEYEINLNDLNRQI